MEKRINKKIGDYVTNFKDFIRTKITELDFNEKSKVNDLLLYLYDYERLSLLKDDLVKRKRIKNTIPVNNRCNAKRANGEQCTRRRKDSCDYCGTHVKGTPHGFIQINELVENTSHKLEVFAQNISGIIYYIDKYDNVYKTEDILEGKQNPAIIAKIVRQENRFTIPDLGLF